MPKNTKDMKYAKLTIVIVAIVAAVVGIVYIVTTSKANDEIIIEPSTVKEETVVEDIHNKIENAPNNKFCTNAYDEVLKTINYFFANEPSNKNRYTNNLQGAYTEKFVQQAMYVFNHNMWNSNDIRTIRNENKKCLKFSPDNKGLKKISSILKDYDRLVEFNSEVSTACKQKPKCKSNSNYLYTDDDWNITETNKLLSSIPYVSSEAKNSPQYRISRENEVRKKLQSAHKRFIECKMDCAEKEAQSYRHNDSRYNDWEKMGKKLYDNFNTYLKRWGTIDDNWLERVADWEKYARSETIND